jgi:ATP-dependent DNA ligase
VAAAPTQLPLELTPMEAEAVEELPAGAARQCEPMYDGIRCLARLKSKSQKPSWPRSSV